MFNGGKIMKNKRKSLINGIVISSIIFIVIGIYYLIISGIPYQDAPMELLIKYEVNQKVGEICIGFGLGLLMLWIISKIIIMLINRRSK